MIFQPQPPSYGDADDIIKIEMSDGPLISAIFLKNPEAEYTVLFNHGNAEDLGNIREFLTVYHDLGFSVFSYDYPGYGTSPGRPTTGNTYKAADAALKHLVENLDIDLKHIIIHGRSVGGGPAIYLAYKNNVAGLIVESSFVSAFRVLTRVTLLPFDKFKNIDIIDKVDCPVLVIHGKDDRTIPFWHGEKLFKKAKEPKSYCWLDGASHHYIPEEAGMAYLSAITKFPSLINSSRTNVRK